MALVTCLLREAQHKAKVRERCPLVAINLFYNVSENIVLGILTVDHAFARLSIAISAIAKPWSGVSSSHGVFPSPDYVQNEIPAPSTARSKRLVHQKVQSSARRKERE
jgi:hypothetical protein